MSQAIPAEAFTAADLVERFGPILLSRVYRPSIAGAAVEADVVEAHDHEDRLCELIDGILLEKTVGTYEAYLAGLLVHFLTSFVQEHDLGVVLPPDGMLRLAPNQVRIPDVSFISWSSLPGRRIPREPIADIVPDLAVEVISRWNTRQEMDRKLKDYFEAGVRLVWYVYPTERRVVVFEGVEQPVVVDEKGTLEGGQVVPGFSLKLDVLFKD